MFVRNTWDRILSIYLYLDKRIRETEQGIAFKRWPKEWIDTNSDINAFLKHFSDKYGPAWIEDMHEIFYSQMRWIRDQKTGKEYDIDFIGRYENLQKDFDSVCEAIGREHIQLPITNSTQHQNYRAHYSQEAREIVARAYREEIEYFGFTF